MGLTDLDHFAEVKSLSPGMRMKLYLLKLILEGSTILLLDEPTNHLDIEGIEWLESYLSAYRGIVVVISHDLEFLNNTIDQVFEIDEQKLNIYQGNYDSYLLQKELYRLERAKQVELYNRKKQQLDKLLESARRIRGGKRRGKAVKAAKTRISRQEQQKVEEYKEVKLGRLSLQGNVRRTKQILKVEDVSFGYSGDDLILDGVNLSIFGSEKIWLLGANGIGKSTFINLITGKYQPTAGSYQWGVSLSWRYFSQEQDHLPEDITLQDYFLKSTKLNYYESFGVLEKFLFPKSMFKYKISRLSPGQTR